MRSPLVSRRVLRTASALTLALCTGLTVSVALPATAGAAAPPATAAVGDNGHVLLYKAAAAQTNKVSVTESFTSGYTDIIYVIDDIVPISAGSGCGHPDSADHTKVSCKVATLDSQDPYSTLTMDLGDGNDTVAFNNTTGQVYYFNVIYLGAGKDKLTDTGRVDGNNVFGQAGDDTITVGEASMVFAGDGNDTIYAGGNYTRVEGGKGNDKIRGAKGNQILYGMDGNDAIYGGVGNDLLYGGKGNDVVYGNSGNDTLYGNSGNDKLYGGPGKDKLSGGPGRNTIRQN
jgi:Ca2+-binding RTX toxin-like protein